MIQIEKNVAYTQAFGCRFCLHIGGTVIAFGKMTGGRGPRLELCTERHWFRWSRGFKKRGATTIRDILSEQLSEGSVTWTDEKRQTMRSLRNGVDTGDN